MRDTTLTMVFNTERLDALTYHMGKKEADLQVEMNDYLQKPVSYTHLDVYKRQAVGYLSP